MKKILYTLLAVSIIFSACEEDTPLPAPNNNTNNNNSALAIGDTHQGGIIFYLDANGGGLIAAPSDQSSDAEWGCYNTEILGADGSGIETGNQNTIDIEAGCNETETAADICANLTIDGYSDWFLPSKDELNEMYLNKAIIGGFSPNSYWSSTEADNLSANMQRFSDGFQSDSKEYKDYTYSVRAVRAF